MNEATLDTNIFIRHITQDLPEKLEQTKKIFDTIESGKLTDLVSILVIKEIIVVVLETMQKNKFDFTDVYLAHTTPKDKLISFDKDIVTVIIR